MTEENEQLIKELVESESDRADLRNQLRAVDAVLARRDVLDDIPGRIDKIVLAISEAARADSRKGQLELKEAAYQTALKSYDDLLKAEHALSESYLRMREIVGNMHLAPHGSEGVGAMYIFTEAELSKQLAERDRLQALLSDNKSAESALITMQAQRNDWRESYLKESKLRENESESRERWRRFYLTLKSVLERDFHCEVLSSSDEVTVKPPKVGLGAADLERIQQAMAPDEASSPQQATDGGPNPDYDPGFYQEQALVERELYTLRGNYTRVQRRLEEVERRYHSLLEENHIRQTAMKNPGLA